MSGSFSSILQEFAGLDLLSADHSVGPRAAAGAGAGAGAKAAAMPAVPVSIPAPPATALSSSGRSDSLLVHTLRLGERPTLLAQRVTIGVAVQDICVCMYVCVMVDLLSTWGDCSYVGLAGLQLLGSDAKGALLPLDPTQLKMTIGTASRHDHQPARPDLTCPSLPFPSRCAASRPVLCGLLRRSAGAAQPAGRLQRDRGREAHVAHSLQRGRRALPATQAGRPGRQTRRNQVSECPSCCHVTLTCCASWPDMI